MEVLSEIPDLDLIFELCFSRFAELLKGEADQV